MGRSGCSARELGGLEFAAGAAARRRCGARSGGWPRPRGARVGSARDVASTRRGTCSSSRRKRRWRSRSTVAASAQSTSSTKTTLGVVRANSSTSSVRARSCRVRSRSIASGGAWRASSSPSARTRSSTSRTSSPGARRQARRPRRTTTRAAAGTRGRGGRSTGLAGPSPADVGRGRALRCARRVLPMPDSPSTITRCGSREGEVEAGAQPAQLDPPPDQCGRHRAERRAHHSGRPRRCSTRHSRTRCPRDERHRADAHEHALHVMGVASVVASKVVTPTSRALATMSRATRCRGRGAARRPRPAGRPRRCAARCGTGWRPPTTAPGSRSTIHDHSPGAGSTMSARCRAGKSAAGRGTGRSGWPGLHRSNMATSRGRRRRAGHAAPRPSPVRDSARRSWLISSPSQVLHVLGGDALAADAPVAAARPLRRSPR